MLVIRPKFDRTLGDSVCLRHLPSGAVIALIENACQDKSDWV